MGQAKESLQEIVELINQTPKARAVFVTNVAGKDTDWDMTFQFNLDDEDPFYLKVESQEAKLGDGEAVNPEIIMTGSPDAIVNICKGQGDFTHAISREQITVEQGKVMDVIRLSRAITAALRTK